MQKKWVKPEQTHKDILTRYQVNKPMHLFFNDVLRDENKKGDIYGFLKPNYWFQYDYSIERIVETFRAYPHVCGVYTDFVDKKPKFLDAFSPSLQPMNTSFFINARYKNLFEFPPENCFDNVIFQIIHKGLLMIHIAEQLLCRYE